MSKKASVVSLITLLLFLAAFQGLLVDFGEAALWSVPETPDPIYIRSDGSIEPLSDVIQKVGDLYFLTGDLDNSIEVQRDHIVIDGNGFSITQSPIDTTGFMIPAGFYPGIRLDDRTNVTVKNVKITDCFSGITLQRATNITLTNSIITGTERISIFSGSSKDCTFSQNSITSRDQGMLIINSTRIHISENIIERNRIGIHVSLGGGYYSHYVAIIQNSVSGSGEMGITVEGGYQIFIIGNEIADNNLGISVSHADCTVHHNNFVNNVESVKSNTCPGPWDDGREGNYWSDYDGIDLNGDGIGDTPYIVETPRTWLEPTTNTTVTFGVHAQDNYPLMAAVDISSLPIDLPVFLPATSSPSPPLDPELSPDPAPSPDPETSLPSLGTEVETGEFPITLLLAASALLLFVIGLVVLVYLDKFRRSGSKLGVQA
jgi:parallel beta-helix repeat protein